MPRAVTRQEALFAEALAVEQGDYMRQVFMGQQVDVEDKKGTPVTIADKTIQKAVNEAYAGTRGVRVNENTELFTPRRRKVVGEEGGTAGYGTRDAIYIDPIDGTSDFIAGQKRSPRRSLAALSMGDVSDGVSGMGTINLPLLRIPTMYQAIRDHGAYRIQNGQRQKLPRVDDGPTHGIVLVSNSNRTPRRNREIEERLTESGFTPLRLSGAVVKACIVFDQSLLKIVDNRLNPNNLPVVSWTSDGAWAHDYMGVAGIAPEVHAEFSGLDGKSLKLGKEANGCVFSRNERTHNLVLAAMRG